MLHAYRRLLLLFGLLVVTLVIAASCYQLGMSRLEGEHRDFWRSLEWASETLTTTGYGSDNHWNHPVMVVFVVGVQFFGLLMTIAVVPVVLIPWFESRFEPRLPRGLPDLDQLSSRSGSRPEMVLIYRWGPAVTSLVGELDRQGIRAVIVEENEARARWLRDHGHTVVFANLEESQFDLAGIERCRAVVAAGADHDNASLISAARQRGYRGRILAVVDNPRHIRPMKLVGADMVCSPKHSLAVALAAAASDRIAPRVSGMELLGGEVELAELRVSASSPIAGKTLAGLDLRGQTGATIVGQWTGGEFLGQPHHDTVISTGAIIVALGGADALARLGEWATPLDTRGPILVLGYGELGQQLVDTLESVDETVRVVARDAHARLDVCGDALDHEVLRPELATARAVILAFSDDSTTMFATTILRDAMPNLPIIAAVERAEDVPRVKRAGADVALSISEVTGQLLGQELFGDSFATTERPVRVFEAASRPFVGMTLASAKIPERTACTLVAIRRDREILADLRGESTVASGDLLLLVGPVDAVARFFAEFPDTRIG